MHLKIFSFLFLSFLTCFNVFGLEEKQEIDVDPDVGLNVMQIVRKRGYEIEEHQVETKDDYILTLYRIPKSYHETQKNIQIVQQKPVVYLIHGLLDSSFTFVNNFRDQSLAYLLADKGYDVWLGNNRGTTWSKGHKSLALNSKEYWAFSWEHMAYYDMPAFVSYILKKTQRPTISYIGHSEGTMQAFAGFSMNQQLAKRISYFGALSPVTYVGNQRSPIFSALVTFRADKIFQLLGMKEFFKGNTFIQNLLGKYGCTFLPEACGSVLNLFNGIANNLNRTRIPVYVGQTPAGTSTQNIAHFSQGVRHGTFGHYDYGCKCNNFPWKYLPDRMCLVSCRNRDKYGTRTPPQFDLSKLEYPRMGFYIGTKDWLATPEDVKRTVAAIPPNTIIHQKYVPYNHLDFTWANNAKTLVYDDLISQIEKYEGKGYV